MRCACLNATKLTGTDVVRASSIGTKLRMALMARCCHSAVLLYVDDYLVQPCVLVNMFRVTALSERARDGCLATLPLLLRGIDAKSGKLTPVELGSNS
jgi:hypothetical protein